MRKFSMFNIKNVYEKKSWQLVIYCWLAYMTVYIGRKNLSVCLADMINDGVTDSVSGGVIGTGFMLCYAIGQFINGWVGDHVHPRFMICIGLMGAGLMNILMGLNSVNILFLVIWGMCGFFCSMLWSPILRAVSIWTTNEISQLAGTSLTATIPIGTICCYLICALGLRLGNWRISFMICGTVLVIMAAILSFCFGTLKDHMISETVSRSEMKSGTSDTVSPVKIRIFCAGLVFAACGILFNGMLKDGLDLWIPTVLSEKFIPSSSVVSLICTLLPLVNIFGAYAARYVFQHFQLDELSTCGVMFAISTVSLAIVTIFLYVSPVKEIGAVIGLADIVLVILITLLLAVCSASMLGANTMLLTFIPLHFGKIGRAATITGMLNCFSYAAAAVSSIAIGYISETFDWAAVFAIFSGAALAGTVICFSGRRSLKQKMDEIDTL